MSGTAGAQIDLLAMLFHGLSEPSRLAILAALWTGEKRVSDIVATTRLSQPNASKQLSCLRDCGLVERERRGREAHYRVAPAAKELLGAADAFLAVHGDEIASCPRYGVRRRRAA